MLLRQELVPSFLADHKYVILALHSGVFSFNTNIANHFHDRHKEAWWLGTINQGGCPDGWAAKYVGSLWEDTGQSIVPRAPDGYYLFVGGRATAYHSGKAKPLQEDGPPLSGHPLWVIGVGMLSTMAQIQHDFHQGAKDAIEHFELALNAPPAADPAPAIATPTPAPDPYKVLELDRTSALTFEKLKAAYHRAITRAHPDKLNDKHPMLVELANELTRQANAAFGQIRKERGW